MRRARRLDARAGKRRGITFSDSYGASLPYSLAYRMAASGTSASFARARADGSSCPFCDIRRTMVSRRRHSKASPPRWSLDRPDPRDRNAGSTGTPCAKQPLASSRRREPRYACSRVNSIRSCCARLPPIRSFRPARGASACITAAKSPRSNAAKPRAKARRYETDG